MLLIATCTPGAVSAAAERDTSRSPARATESAAATYSCTTNSTVQYAPVAASERGESVRENFSADGVAAGLIRRGVASPLSPLLHTTSMPLLRYRTALFTVAPTVQNPVPPHGAQEFQLRYYSVRVDCNILFRTEVRVNYLFPVDGEAKLVSAITVLYFSRTTCI